MTFLIIALITTGIGYSIAINPDRFYLRIIPFLAFFSDSTFVNFIMKFRKPMVDKFVMKWELAELVGNCTGKEFRERVMGDLDRLLFSELDYIEFLGKNNVHDLALDNDTELASRVNRFIDVISILDTKLGISTDESVVRIMKRKYGNIINSLVPNGI